MSKRLVILFCVLFAVAFAVPAFAAVQNIKVSGDILARSVYRNNFDLRDSTASDYEDQISVFNSVVRLRVDADLTDNVSTVVRLINERNWDEANASNTDIDLDLAYITLKEFLYSPLTLTIGRQELHFGNDMVMGDGVGTPVAGAVSGSVGTNQTTNYTEATGYSDSSAGTQTVNGDLAYRKAFDAIRATLNYDPLVIDVVIAKIDENNITSDPNDDDVDLYGMNTSYKFDDKWNTLAETYLWSKLNSANDKSDKVYTVGGRVSTNPTKKLNLQQEIAYQGGLKRTSASVERDRNAWAAQSIIMLTPGWKYNPTLGLIYSYFSGDADRDAAGVTSAKDFHAWDPMFENQTSGHIINALFPQSNAHNANAMARLTPIEDVTLQLDYVYLAMAKAGAWSGALNMNDYDSSGWTYQANKKELGQEFDVALTYDYTEDVQLGLLAGWFWPGKALAKTNREQANELIASCKVAF